MDRVGEADILALEIQLSQRLVRDFKLNLRTQHEHASVHRVNGIRESMRALSG